MTSSSAVGYTAPAPTSLNTSATFAAPKKPQDAKATPASLLAMGTPAIGINQSPTALPLSVNLATTTPLTRFSAPDMAAATGISNSVNANPQFGSARRTGSALGTANAASSTPSSKTSAARFTDAAANGTFSFTNNVTLPSFDPTSFNSSQPSLADPNYLAKTAMTFGTTTTPGLVESLSVASGSASPNSTDSATTAETPSDKKDFFAKIGEDIGNFFDNAVQTVASGISSFFQSAVAFFDGGYSGGSRADSSNTASSSTGRSSNLGTSTYVTFQTTAEAVKAVGNMKPGDALVADIGTLAQLQGLGMIDSAGRVVDPSNAKKMGQLFASALDLQSRMASNPEEAGKLEGDYATITGNIKNFVGAETYKRLIGPSLVVNLNEGIVASAKVAGSKIQQQSKALQTAPTQQARREAKDKLDSVTQSATGSSSLTNTNKLASLSANASQSATQSAGSTNNAQRPGTKQTVST